MSSSIDISHSRAPVNTRMPTTAMFAFRRHVLGRFRALTHQMEIVTGLFGSRLLYSLDRTLIFVYFDPRGCRGPQTSGGP